MPKEFLMDILKAQWEASEKYTYFLLAGVGAAIGFAANQTKDVTLSWSKIPLGLAIASWVISFIYGSLNLIFHRAVLRSNLQLFYVNSNEERERLENDMRNYSDKGAGYGLAQVLSFGIGAGFYIIWHILEMYLRS